MRRLYLIIIYMCLTLVVGRVHAQYYSVNYDKQIVAAMAAAFGAGAMAESYYNEQVGEIFEALQCRRGCHCRHLRCQVLGAQGIHRPRHLEQ